MTNLTRSNFQAHPFHLVSPSPWPLFTSVALLALTTSGVSTMHSFNHAGYIWFLALIAVISSMSLWFRDVISEGIKKIYILYKINKDIKLNIVKAIDKEYIQKSLINRDNTYKYINDDDQLGYYLAGLLEGDGHISIPALGSTTLNRILNPRIVFTSHKNNLHLYAYIQDKLGGIGRFQLVNNNTIRYIIGDIKGIMLIINKISNKLRTPKNITFNKLIDFMNTKYNFSFKPSTLDKSNLLDNYWFSGFTEADGCFYIKIVESKPKSETRKRSISENISLKFRLDQRLYDKPTSSTMLFIMEEIAKCLSSSLDKHKTSKGDEILSITVTSIDKIKIIVNYFNKYSLLGTKYIDYSDWEKVYYMMINKEHLTEIGRSKIKLIKSNMNNKRIT
jgi:LAGLIDADG endonuclease/Cytochrome c oxidase subunit III